MSWKLFPCYSSSAQKLSTVCNMPMVKPLLSIFSIDVTVLRKLPAYKTWQLIVETVPPNNGNIKSRVKSVELVMNQSEVLIVANWCRQLVYCVFCSPRSIKIIYLFLVKQKEVSTWEMQVYSVSNRLGLFFLWFEDDTREWKRYCSYWIYQRWASIEWSILSRWIDIPWIYVQDFLES